MNGSSLSQIARNGRGRSSGLMGNNRANPAYPDTLVRRQARYFAVAIGAYILKDRIKEIIRRQLSKRWSPWDRLYHFSEAS